jgi:hypothetical protein
VRSGGAGVPVVAGACPASVTVRPKTAAAAPIVPTRVNARMFLFMIDLLVDFPVRTRLDHVRTNV